MFLWNCLKHAWVKNLDSGTVTYNPFDAQQFATGFTFDKQLYSKSISNDFFDDIKNSEDESSHNRITITKQMFNVGYRSKLKISVTEPVHRFINSFKDKDYTLLETKELWGYKQSGSWYAFNSIDETLLNIRKKAIKSMTQDGWHNIAEYLQYIRLSKDFNFKDPIDHTFSGIDDSPVTEIKKGHTLFTQKDLNSPFLRTDFINNRIKGNLRSLISHFRFGNTFKSSNNKIKIKGRLPSNTKDYIRLAYKIMTTAHTIKVIGNSFTSSQPYTANCCYLGDSGFNNYSYLYIANINGHNQSFVFNNEVNFITKNNINTYNNKTLELNSKIKINDIKLNKIRTNILKNNINEFRYSNRARCNGYTINSHKTTGSLRDNLKNIIKQNISVVDNNYGVYISGISLANTDLNNPQYKYKLLFKSINEDGKNVCFSPSTYFEL
jgi:hypothetical protein